MVEVPSGGGAWPGVETHIARWDPARVLAECEAKRKIVKDLYPEWAGAHGGPNYCSSMAEEVLELLTLPYDGHPDFDESWRP